ncbi:MAG TPA: thioesterase family protein [Alphaproteobacteria bacterium]
MKSTLAKGLTSTKRFTVDRDRTISFMGEEMRVYATPSMVRDVEHTCLEFLKQHLDEGENSVGARVEIDHLGPTLLDMPVEVTATIVDIDGRRVTFEVEVKDPLETVGKAKHIRFVVDLARQKSRLEQKRDKVKAAKG